MAWFRFALTGCVLVALAVARLARTQGLRMFPKALRLLAAVRNRGVKIALGCDCGMPSRCAISPT